MWIVFIALVGFVAFATLAPVGLRPRTGHVVLERVAAFFVLGAVLTLALPRRPGWALAVVCLAAVGLELAQKLAPGRHARLPDALEKMAGGVSGVAVAVAVITVAGWWRARR